MFRVSYLHYAGTYGNPYRVSRSFDTREAAEDFINVNTMVYPLPGLQRDYPLETHYYPTETYEIPITWCEDTSNHFPSTEDADGF